MPVWMGTIRGVWRYRYVFLDFWENRWKSFDYTIPFYWSIGQNRNHTLMFARVLLESRI